jgi:hypothetical protein
LPGYLFLLRKSISLGLLGELGSKKPVNPVFDFFVSVCGLTVSTNLCNGIIAKAKRLFAFPIFKGSFLAEERPENGGHSGPFPGPGDNGAQPGRHAK